MEWLWQNVFSEYVATALAALAALILGFLREKYPNLTSKILYGLAVFCLTLVSFGAFKYITTLPKEIPQVNSENVEAHIRKWLDRFEIRTRRIADRDSHFSYEIMLTSTHILSLNRHKELENYITLEANVEVLPQHKAILASMKKEQIYRLVLEVSLEMAKTSVESVILPVSPPLAFQQVRLHRRIPISNNLTEDTFMQRIHEVNLAMTVVRNTIALGLDRLNEKNALQ